jgi:hypothetical protein
MIMKKLVFLIINFLFFSCLIFSQNSRDKYFKNFNPKSYICYKTDKPIIIDGKIDEDSWEKVIWTDDFVDIEGNLKPLPRFRTRAKMLWDEKFLYIAAELVEPNIWATLSERDTIIFYDNDFEIFIDPDGDTHQYYEFEMNAFNTVWDLLLIKPYRDGGPAVNAWDIKGLKTGVNINGTINHPGDKDECWIVEVAFPWDILKECANKNTPPKLGDQWRVNFSRVEWKVEVKNGQYQKSIDPKTGKPFAEDNWVWSPQGVINMHYPETWGFVQFSDKTVGIGEDRFKYNQEEDAKWALRLVYYAQRKYYEKNKRFSIDINELDLKDLKIDGYSWPPAIQCTESQFEAIINKINRNDKLHIVQDGKTWKTSD